MRKTREGSKQGGVFIDAGESTGQRIDDFLIGYGRDGRLRGGLRFWLMIFQLVDGDNISIMREKHLAVDCGWDGRHGIGVTTPQNNVIVKRGIDYFNVDTNSLARNGDGTVTEKADGLGGMAIPHMKGDCGRGQFRRSNLFPNRSIHHIGRCPLINNTPRHVSILDFDWDLEIKGGWSD